MDIRTNSWVFQNSVTTTGNGETFTVGRNNQLIIFITGTSTSRTIYFEGSDAESTPNWYPIPAVKLPELTTVSSTIGNNEVYAIDLAPWFSVRCRISAVSGGTVKIVGRIVESGTSLISNKEVSNTLHDSFNVNANLQVNNADNSVSNPAFMSLTGSKVEEQKTQINAVGNVITFTENISAIEIYHESPTWQSFTVNGLTLTIPAGGWATLVGGTPAKTVTIPAGINCIVGRLV